MTFRDHPLLGRVQERERRWSAKTPAEMRAESIRMWGEPKEPAPDGRGLTDWGDVIKFGMAARDRKVEEWVANRLLEHGIDPSDGKVIAERCVLFQRDPVVKYDENGERLYDEEGPGEMWMEIDGTRVTPGITYSGDLIP